MVETSASKWPNYSDKKIKNPWGKAKGFNLSDTWKHHALLIQQVLDNLPLPLLFSLSGVSAVFVLQGWDIGYRFHEPDFVVTLITGI